VPLQDLTQCSTPFKTFKSFDRFALFKTFWILGFERELPHLGNSRNVERLKRLV
jgi:hypothetical protein